MHDGFETYREELNGLRLTEESRRALAERLAHRSPAKVRRRWPRPALIAAGLCVALAGTALAAELVGGLIGADLGEPRDKPAYDHTQKRETVESGYSIEVSDIRRFPLSTFPQEMLDLYKDRRNSNMKKFSSPEEAEQFIGVKLADNPVLDRLSPHVWKDDYTGISFRTFVGCLDWTPKSELHPIEGTSRYLVSSSYYMESPETVQRVYKAYVDGELTELTGNFPATHVSIDVDATLYTEVYDSLETGDIWTTVGKQSENGIDITMTSHTTPGGVEIPIARFDETHTLEDGSENESFAYRAHFAVDGILYQVEARGEPEEEVLSLLEEILDGYEIMPSEAE